MVGVLLDQFLEAPAGEEFAAVVVQLEGDRGAVAVRGRRLDVVARPCRRSSRARPPPGRPCGVSDVHLVGDHVAGVEADAEAADQVGVLALVLGQGFQEAPGAGAGYGAEVFHEVGFVHAYAVVRDGQGPGFLVEGYADARVEGYGLVGVVGHGQVLELVDGVGGVGHEFAEEYFPVRIQRMDDEVEQLAHLGLERFLGH